MVGGLMQQRSRVGKRRGNAQQGRVTPYRRLVAVALIAALVSLLGYSSQMLLGNAGGLMSAAQASPSPGKPGGNSSKPGDNKKKDKKEKKQQRKSGSDSGSSRDSGGSGEDSSASDDVGSDHKSQTEQNNRWSADGANRSVNNRVTRETSQSESGQQPLARPGTEQIPDQVTEVVQRPELVTDVSSRNPLEEESFQYFRGDNPARRVPGRETSRRLREQVERYEKGETDAEGNRVGKYFNRDPFNEGVQSTAMPEADHLIPVDQVVRMPRFAELSWEDQEKILDSDINIVPATRSENGSRQNKLFTDYSIRSKDGRPLDEAYRQSRIAQTYDTYDQLQKMIDDAYAAGSRRPDLPPASNGPVEMPTGDRPLEVPVNQQPVEMPPVSAPPEAPPVRVPEQPVTPPVVEVSGNPVPPVSNYPLPPVRPVQPPNITNPVGRPTIGAPVAPTGTALPPIPTAAPPTVGVPVTVVPTFSTPAGAPVAVPDTTDQLSAVRHELTALGIEANTIADRMSALQNAPGFDTRPADIAEFQALQALSSEVSARSEALSGALQNLPEHLQPPPSGFQKTMETLGSGLTALGGAALSALNFVRRPFAILSGG